MSSSKKQNIIVSAFLSEINSRNDRNTQNYIDFGIKLLETSFKKMIFLDSGLWEHIDKNKYQEVDFIKIDKNDLYLYKYKDTLQNFCATDRNESKNTLNYMFLICHKTEFIRRAIEYYHEPNYQYVWVDFGLRHIFKTDLEFSSSIKKLSNRYDHVRIGSIWNLQQHYLANPYKDVMWYFAGGVFGGDQSKLIKFADLVKKECIRIVTDLKLITWEVNIWHLVYIKNKELFSPYQCDHNMTLVDNY